MKVIVGVVKYLGPLTPFIMLDSVEQRVLVSGKLELFQWRLFCGICFFCLDVGCRRVVLRYRVNECVKYMFMDTVRVCASYTGHAIVYVYGYCVCVLDILGMQLYRLFAYDCVTCASF